MKFLLPFGCLLFLVALTPTVTFSQKVILQLMDTIHQREFETYEYKARDNFFIFPDSTIYYAEKCKNIAVKQNNLFCKLIAQNLIGYGQWLKGSYAISIETFLSTLKLTETAKESAFKNYCLLETNDGLGCAYCDAGFFEQGMPYLYQAKKLATESIDTSGILSETTSIGMYYEKNSQLDSAEYYLTNGLSVSNRIGTTAFTPALLYELGNCKMKRGMINEAVTFWKKAISYVDLDNLSSGQANQSLGKYYFDKGYFDSAYSSLKKAVQLANQTNNIQNLFEANDLLLSLFKKTKNADSVNFYLALCYNLKDSVAEKEKTKDLQSLIINERIRQQSIEEENIKYRNRFTVLIFGGVILALVLLAIFQFRNIKQKLRAKNKIEQAYSELKTTQAQLIQSEKMASLGELTAGIAHEIQNPLNFVNNFSDVNTELVDELKEELKAGNTEEAISIANDIKENEQKINHHGKRADSIVKGMLQHSRSSSGIKESTDINALADEYLRLAYHGLRAKDKSFNAILKTDLDKTVGNIRIIPQDIGRVLLNLFTNAFYAVDEKKKSGVESLHDGQAGYEPSVSLSTKKVNGKVQLIVADNGNGIPAKILDKIFQPFFTTKPTGQGTGLGLSLAYDIIKAHGGEIKVETNAGEAGPDHAVGRGTTFIIQLPIE